MVLRIQYVTDGVPAAFPMRSNSTVEYDHARLGDKAYLLPARATVRTVSEPDEARNEVDFHSYRKFSSESQLKFPDAPPAP